MFVSPRGGLAQRNPPFFDYAGYADAVIAETLEREARAAGQARRAGWPRTVEKAARFIAFYGAVARQGVYFNGARESCCSSRPVTNAHDAWSRRSRFPEAAAGKGRKLKCVRSLQRQRLQPSCSRHYRHPPKAMIPTIILTACNTENSACPGCVISQATGSARPRPPGQVRIAAPTRDLHMDGNSPTRGARIVSGDRSGTVAKCRPAL
jgi:hypothetical protein